jgi:biopolymer transport protein ExbB
LGQLLKVLAQGGLVMVPLAACSLLSATVIIERFLALRRADRGGMALLTAVRRAALAGDRAGALAQCEQVGGPVANVLAAGLQAHSLGASPTEAMEEQTLAEMPALQRRLAVLDTVVTLAPLLGLLGTVLGMISAFRIISVSGASHPAGITGGVAEALVATATGLGIAIFSLIGYNWCRDKLRRISEEIELRATQLENVLRLAEREPGVSREPAPERATRPAGRRVLAPPAPRGASPAREEAPVAH